MHRCFNEDFDGNAKPSQRGKYKRSTAKHEAVRAHIQTFNPTGSHYRRQHAPKPLYLPSDLTEMAMHEKYQQSASPDLKVSYSFYSHVMSELRISLVKLGHEECETCVSVSHHQKQTGHSEETSTCSICGSRSEHMRLATVSRAEYRNDGLQVRPNEITVAVDLQKVKVDSKCNIQFNINLFILGHSITPLGWTEVNCLQSTFARV